MPDQESSPYLRMITASGLTRHPGGLGVTKMLLDRAQLNEDSRVLDIGCGAGHTSAFVAKTYGARVFGVDRSLTALENAKALYKAEPYFSKMCFEQADIACLPFSDGYFDAILCESVLLFVKDKSLAVAEMHRVLKPGGFLAMNEIFIEEKRKKKALQKYFARPELGAYVPDSHELLDMVSSLGFKIVIENEQSLDIKRQLWSDFSQFFNMKGLLQMLEFMHQALVNSDVRHDILALLKHAKDYQPGALESLRTLAMLAQK